eukprot:10169288-Prorocentrum_lima.AAC.1
MKDRAISDRTSEDLMIETKAAVAAVCEGSRAWGDKSAREQYRHGRRRELSELVLDLERRMQVPFEALHNHARDL